MSRSKREGPKQEVPTEWRRILMEEGPDGQPVPVSAELVTSTPSPHTKKVPDEWANILQEEASQNAISLGNHTTDFSEHTVPGMPIPDILKEENTSPPANTMEVQHFSATDHLHDPSVLTGDKFPPPSQSRIVDTHAPQPHYQDERPTQNRHIPIPQPSGTFTNPPHVGSELLLEEETPSTFRDETTSEHHTSSDEYELKGTDQMLNLNDQGSILDDDDFDIHDEVTVIGKSPLAQELPPTHPTPPPQDSHEELNALDELDALESFDELEEVEEIDAFGETTNVGKIPQAPQEDDDDDDEDGTLFTEALPIPASLPKRDPLTLPPPAPLHTPADEAEISHTSGTFQAASSHTSGTFQAASSHASGTFQAASSHALDTLIELQKESIALQQQTLERLESLQQTNETSSTPQVDPQLETRLGAQFESQLHTALQQHQEQQQLATQEQFEELQQDLEIAQREQRDTAFYGIFQDFLQLFDFVDLRFRTLWEHQGEEHLAVQEMGAMREKLLELLHLQELRPIDTNSLQYDPTLHRALQESPTNQPNEDGQIARIFRQGFFHKDKVFRPTEVEVMRYRR
ncbi:MAG: nucleotide exchange factor GrpE [Deltaproteobacteria bacterium]|mgnify:CR=1 FL=1|nr:nucleotide exchange factor GrpE [Deltaproteobacteria bacterium]|tara:strand:- start:280 stop:2004 length:1725 start_codon:yes stop_codon:yes gene_type:complete